MDSISNTSNYFLNHTNFPYNYQDTSSSSSNIIDLGLSLRALQPQPYIPSRHERYIQMANWNQFHPEMNSTNATEDEAVESKPRWDYVKVNMDGVIVGRKVCIGELMDYSSLAIQLEDMFGCKTISGLRLFQVKSDFFLFYKNGDAQWRTVGDVPWRAFVGCVHRLRIVHKNDVFAPSSSSSSTFA